MATVSGGSSTRGKIGKRSSTHAAKDSSDRANKSKNSSDDFSPTKKRKSNSPQEANSLRNDRQKDKGDVAVKVIKEEKLDEPLKDWPTEDLSTLINNIFQELPKSDKVKYSTQQEKLDWDKICFGNYSPISCRMKWTQVTKKVRRFRTLTELVEDAKEWVKHPWTTYSAVKTKVWPLSLRHKHPDLPKKPLTPYFRYFLEKRERYSEIHPDMSMTELAKLLAKKYGEMSDKKKQRYKEGYEKENEQYKVIMEKFRVEHPDLFPFEQRSGRGSGKRANGPQKPQTPAQLFLSEKMTKHTNMDPLEKKNYEEKYRQLWRNLNDSKRVKWIRKALANEQQYAVELAQYSLENPDFKYEPMKAVITKAEKEILDEIEGKPKKPPNSGYSLYSKIMLKQLTNIPSKEKMVEISRRWREMSEEERQAYTQEVTEATVKYKNDYADYVQKLPEEERKLLETKGRKRKAVTKEQSNGNSKPKKPMSALFFYQQEKMPSFRLKHPDKSEQESTRLLVREFGELSEKKKEKYKKMAEEAKKNMSEKTATPVVRRQKLFKGEPKKPTQSGYLLYTTELIGKMVDVEPKLRMAEISSRWKALPASEQDKYKKRAAEMVRKYGRDMKKFLCSLSEEDHKLYTQLRKKGNVKDSRPQRKVKVVATSNAETSDDDDDDDDQSDKDATASSNESGSQSEKSSDESDRSDSGSDSRSDSESGTSSDSDNTRDSTASSSSEESDSEASDSDSDSSSGSDK